MSDWRPGATRAALVARARLLARIRQFFAERDVLEVDTPLVARFGVTDPAIEPLRVSGVCAGPASLFLQTSPEFAMKRLLAAGSGAIYQLGKAFRDGESGARHNPEFTMLEWYRPSVTLEALMDEVAALVVACLGDGAAPAVRRATHAELFEAAVGIDPHRADEATLAHAARRHVDTGDLALDRDGWLDLLMSHVVEPTLAGEGLVFIHDYPASQAALATCVERGGVVVAERFELYLGGVELANGYRELRDPAELCRRADRDNARRSAAGQEPRHLDPRLLAAMEAGLPECSGVALGVDRLLMQVLGASRVAEVLPFDWSRC